MNPLTQTFKTVTALLLLVACVGCSSSTGMKKKDNTGACIDRTKAQPDANCMMVYDPVCGCNHKTYGNSCEAEKAGVARWEKGECK